MSDVVSLDELQQRFADALEQERGGFWAAADVAAYAIGHQPTRTAKAAIARTLATVGHMSSNYVRQLSLLSESFGVEYRKPDVAMSLYRAVARVAGKLNRHAGDLLDEALRRGWHVADVTALVKSRDAEPSRLSAHCGDCGSRVTVVTTLPAGLAIPCPVCLAVRAAEGPLDLTLIPKLGVTQ